MASGDLSLSARLPAVDGCGLMARNGALWRAQIRMICMRYTYDRHGVDHDSVMS